MTARRWSRWLIHAAGKSLVATSQAFLFAARIAAALARLTVGADGRRLAHFMTGWKRDAGRALDSIAGLSSKEAVDLLGQPFPPLVSRMTVGGWTVRGRGTLRKAFQHSPGVARAAFQCLGHQQDCRATEDEISQKRARQQLLPAI
jgi:hypothetical protein